MSTKSFHVINLKHEVFGKTEQGSLKHEGCNQGY
jgi:hypothetical protein